MSCDHKGPLSEPFHVDLNFVYLQDDDSKPATKADHYVLELELTCKLCGEPMHFLGPEVGFRFDAPTVDVNRTRIALPFAPGRAPQLGGAVRFQFPTKVKT